MARKLILKNNQAPGDIVMLTAAVRDLHLCYPGHYITDVRTSCPQLWEHNPRIVSLSEQDPEVTLIDCHYPLIHSSGRLPYHFIFGFIEYLNEFLGLRIRPTQFRGEIFLSAAERNRPSRVKELTGSDLPYWIVDAGGKYDFTAKWWAPARFQQVIDHFRNRIQFVQVGSRGHYHPPLQGVINLVGKTDLRGLIHLIYHSVGVLTPVSAPMHLAAAIPAPLDRPQVRPCVVIAGGREPLHWEAYPNHQFIHTLGALPCCAQNGCWKSRVRPLNDGSDKDEPQNICVDVVQDLPRCMDMITAEEVIRRIETYYQGGLLQYQTSEPTYTWH